MAFCKTRQCWRRMRHSSCKSSNKVPRYRYMQQVDHREALEFQVKKGKVYFIDCSIDWLILFWFIEIRASFGTWKRSRLRYITLQCLLQLEQEERKNRQYKVKIKTRWMFAVMGVFNFSVLLLILGQLVIQIEGSGVSYA